MYILVAATLIAAMLSACNEPLGGLDVVPDESFDQQFEEPFEEPEAPRVEMQTMIKSKSTVNVRTGPGLSYKIIGKLDKNDLVAYIETETSWYKTKYKGITAYVNASGLYTELLNMEKSSTEAIERVIGTGYSLLGYPYVWGSERYHWGNGILNANFESGKFDCSALTQYIFYHGAGVLLGLTTREQVKQGVAVEKSNIKRGDLLFFTNVSRYYKQGIERVGHVALYLGDNYILHTASDYAVIEPISASRWQYYINARRFL